MTSRDMIMDQLLSFKTVRFSWQDSPGLVRLSIVHAAGMRLFVIEVYHEDAGFILYRDSAPDDPKRLIARALRTPLFADGVRLEELLCQPSA